MPLMPKEEFAKQVTDYVRIGLPENLDVQLEKKVKINDTEQYYINIRAEGERTAPSICLEEMYGNYVYGNRTVMQAAGSIVDMYEKIQKQAVRLEDWKILDYEMVKQRLGFRIVEIQRNHEWLQDKPYVPVGNGFAKTFVVYAIESERGQEHIVNVTDSMLEQWRCGIRRLETDAAENEMRIHPAELENINTIIRDMFMNDGESTMVEYSKMDDMEELPRLPDGLNMYVLTNSDQMFGASCLYYPGVMEKLGELAGEDYYVFPSSVHEIMVLPVSEIGMELEELKGLTQEVNLSTVGEQEQLSDHVMLYNAREKILSMPFTEIPSAPQKSAAEVSETMKQIIKTAESSMPEVPSGTFKYGQLEQLKRESQMLGVEKYLNFYKGNCDIEIREGFLEQFDTTGKDLSRYQENTKLQEKKIDSPKL